jgi:hypothetical protein
VLVLSWLAAAGVMLYVSFVEIMKKSQEYLACTTEHSALASVGCFFVGVVGIPTLVPSHLPCCHAQAHDNAHAPPHTITQSHRCLLVHSQ